MSDGIAVSESVSLQVKRFVNARRPRVFDAWIKPELMYLWFAPGAMKVASASADARVGGAYRIEIQGDGAVTNIAAGVYTEIVPNELLSFTWGWQNFPGWESLVTVVFKDLEGGTEVILTHERLPNEESRDKHQHGWLGCLSNLARLYDPEAEASTYNGCQ
jgi:glutathione S-transferase